MSLVRPHGGGSLKPLLLEGDARTTELARARTLPQVPLSSRETGDLIMLGIGGFTPLSGFMGYQDWRSVCDSMHTAEGLFWPIPITLSTTHEVAGAFSTGDDVALVDTESGEIMGTMSVTEKYAIEIMTPAQTRALFESYGWSKVAAFQTRNPMHRSHEYLAKVAVETCDGVLVHSLLGALKPGDIPADVRTQAIGTLIDKYFVAKTVVQAGYPLDMRYAGPREALLHALFRQNYGCSHLIVGRDHAGVGSYYGPFDAHHIFDEIPKGALETQALKIDWTFWCYRCGGMASARTCPHDEGDRLLLSGTKLRKMLSEGSEVPAEFSRPEVLEILREYYAGLDASQKVEVKLVGHSAR